MKSEKSICVYRNVEHEQMTLQELQSAKRSMQSVLNAWQELNIGDCQDIGELIMRPETSYKQAIDQLVELPSGGRFTTNKNAHLATLDLPDPSALYATAKKVRQQPYCATSGLYRISGDTVELNETEAEMLIDSQSVYCSDSDKIKLCKDLQLLCNLLNSLNRKLNGDILPVGPWTYNWSKGKFNLRQHMDRGLYEISIMPEYLKKIMV